MSEESELSDACEGQKYLSAIQLDVVYFIERFHASTGESPDDTKIKQRFTGIDDEFLAEFKSHELVLKSMKARGINYPAPADRFTPEQMAAAAAMSDFTDRRSDEKKLRDLGITTRQWATWLQDEEFAGYMRDRSEVMLKNTTYLAHQGLIKGVRNGNIAAIKMHNEITGRYNPDREDQINVRVLLHTFIEVIQKHVKDPLTLHNIATELSSIASRESYTPTLVDSMSGGRHLGIRAATSGHSDGQSRTRIQGIVIPEMGDD